MATNKEISKRTFKATTSTDPTAVTTDQEQMQQLEMLPYYHRRLHRMDTACLLNRQGEFLLRKTTSNGRPAVSVFWQNHVLHFPVRKLDEGYCFESKMFPSIDDLINWHRTNKIAVTLGTGAILKEPKPLASWELLTDQLVGIRKIARGQFGDIYVGKIGLRQDASVHPVVIKTMNGVFGKEGGKEFESAREKLLFEARILRDLGGHTHIVKCYGVTVDTVDGRCLVALELISGGKLDDRLRGNPMLTPKRKLQLAVAAAKALLHVHCHGYLHRNVCAKNFFVELNEHRDVSAVKLTGFDFATAVDSTGLHSGRPNDAFPTPVSSAPESLAAYVWTKRSDVWGWAVCVWEIFGNGAKPYQAEIGTEKCSNPNTVLQALQNGVGLKPHAEMKEPLLGIWRSCFELDSETRPSFYKLIRQILTPSA